jgi:hypothetical protein
MAAKTTKLIAPNGSTVSVASDRVDALRRHGFTEPQKTEEPKAPAKKAAAKKSSK